MDRELSSLEVIVALEKHSSMTRIMSSWLNMNEDRVEMLNRPVTTDIAELKTFIEKAEAEEDLDLLIILYYQWEKLTGEPYGDLGFFANDEPISFDINFFDFDEDEPLLPDNSTFEFFDFFGSDAE